jgi:hypothetical protein
MRSAVTDYEAAALSRSLDTAERKPLKSSATPGWRIYLQSYVRQLRVVWTGRHGGRSTRPSCLPATVPTTSNDRDNNHMDGDRRRRRSRGRQNDS